MTTGSGSTTWDPYADDAPFGYVDSHGRDLWKFYDGVHEGIAIQLHGEDAAKAGLKCKGTGPDNPCVAKFDYRCNCGNCVVSGSGNATRNDGPLDDFEDPSVRVENVPLGEAGDLAALKWAQLHKSGSYSLNFTCQEFADDVVGAGLLGDHQ